ncbi:MAG: hypothetical protein JWR85_4218 [Marmoricola sp.]|nr:hypothetical protein [Marmoricola sp.]
MALKFPKPDHAIMGEIDPDMITNDWRKLCGFRDALMGARAYLQREKAAKDISVLCLRANGNIWLIKVTREAWSKRWDFGNPLPARNAEAPDADAVWGR